MARSVQCGTCPRSRLRAPAATRAGHATHMSDIEIFIVDDDAPVRQALDRLLRVAGYRVRAFASARDVLDGAAEQQPRVPDHRRADAGPQRARTLRSAPLDTGIHPGHFHHRAWRHRDGCARDESRAPPISSRSRSTTRRCSTPSRRRPPRSNTRASTAGLPALDVCPPIAIELAAIAHTSAQKDRISSSRPPMSATLSR